MTGHNEEMVRLPMKNLLKSFLKSSSGFTLAEVMVATGLIGVVGLGAMQLIGQINSVSSRSRVLNDTMSFSSSLGRYIYGPKACDEFRGKTLTAAYTDITLDQWKYEDKTPIGQDSVFGSITLSSLKGKVDTTAGLPQITVASELLTKTMLLIEVGLTAGNKTAKSYYNIPVLTNDTGVVKFCGEMKDAVEICNSMLGVFDAATGKCKVEEVCQVRGSYKLISCAPASYGCSATYGTTTNNPLTGSTTCPVGSVASQTGIQTWNHSVSCGKKCTATVVNTAQWFTCMECP